MRHPPLRHNQKSAIGYNLIQILLSYLPTPSDPPVPLLNTPSRPRKLQTPDPSVFIAPDQVSQLRSTQRSRSQIVIPIHQIAPASRPFTIGTSYHNQLHPAKILQYPAPHRFLRDALQI